MLKKRFALTIISIFLFNILTIRQSFLMKVKPHRPALKKSARRENLIIDERMKKLKEAAKLISELEKSDENILKKSKKLKKLEEKYLPNKRRNSSSRENILKKGLIFQPTNSKNSLIVPERKRVKQKSLRLKKPKISLTREIKSSFLDITSFSNYTKLKEKIFKQPYDISSVKHKTLNQIISSIFQQLEPKFRKQFENHFKHHSERFLKSPKLRHNTKLFHMVAKNYNSIKTMHNFRYMKKEIFNNDEKIIIIGDLHGNYNDFDLIINDLIKREILTPELQLAPGYKIIILGDFIDRGLNSLSIALAMMLIQAINFEQVIILQGNHENMAFDDIYLDEYGIKHYYDLDNIDFYKELSKKTGTKYETYKNQFKEYFKFLPSAYFIKNRSTKQIFMFNHGGWIEMPRIFTKYLKSKQRLIQISKKRADQLIWNDIDFKNETQGKTQGDRGPGSIIYPEKMVSNSMKKFDIVAKFGGHMHDIPKGLNYNWDYYNWEKETKAPGFINYNQIYVLISGDIQSFDIHGRKEFGYNYKATYLELDLSNKKWNKKNVFGYIDNGLDNKFQRTKVPSYKIH